MQGNTGSTGNQGLQGEIGANGAKGDTGAQGIQGIQGLQGNIGATGLQGTQGIQGNIGVTGPQGIQGIQGLQGNVGATGAKGDTGAQGLQGIQGLQGNVGTTGLQGIQGIQGNTGVTGPQGIQGDIGATGAKGDTGAQGIQGDIGATGAKGDTGEPGVAFDDTQVLSNKTWTSSKINSSINAKADTSAVPKKVSQLNNDAGYINKISIPGQTAGDIMFFDGTNWVKVPNGTAGQVLTLNNSGNPVWQSFSVPANILPASSQPLSASNITVTTATINGNVNANGFSTTVSFEYGTTLSYGNTTSATPSTITGNSNTPIIANITGLIHNTIYHFRIKTINAVNTNYSVDSTFTTKYSLPSLTTTAISSITKTTAVSGGNVSDDGGNSIIARGICWSSSANPTLSDSYTIDGSGSGSFISSLTNLSSASTYHVRAYATNAAGTSYGNDISFITISLPIVIVSYFGDYNGTSVSASMGISSNGNSPITDMGFCFSSTNTTPTIADNLSSQYSIIGLTPNTVYYARAYATNGAGTGYSGVITFNPGQVLGSSYGGGIVYYNDGSGHGLISSASDISTSMQWWNGSAMHTNTTFGGFGSGSANTDSIIKYQGAGTYAASACRAYNGGGYNDWYLPSVYELNLLYNQKYLVGLSSNSYWTSCEDNTNSFYATFLYCGNFENQNITTKASLLYVRAIRKF